MDADCSKVRYVVLFLCVTSVHEMAANLGRSGSTLCFLSSFEVMCGAVGSLDLSTLVSFLCVV